MEPYTNTGPISIPSTLDLSGIPGKSVIVTGGPLLLSSQI